MDTKIEEAQKLVEHTYMIELPVYGAKIEVNICEPEHFEIYCGCNGFVHHSYQDEDFYGDKPMVRVFVPFSEYDFGIIIHEFTHVKQCLADYIGTIFDNETEAYIMGYFADEITRIFGEHTKRMEAEYDEHKKASKKHDKEIKND